MRTEGEQIHRGRLGGCNRRHDVTESLDLFAAELSVERFSLRRFGYVGWQGDV